MSKQDDAIIQIYDQARGRILALKQQYIDLAKKRLESHDTGLIQQIRKRLRL